MSHTQFIAVCVCRRLLLCYQHDVTIRTNLEMAMTELGQAQLNLMTQIFPRHFIEHLCVSDNMGGGAPQLTFNHLGRSHKDVSAVGCASHVRQCTTALKSTGVDGHTGSWAGSSAAFGHAETCVFLGVLNASACCVCAQFACAGQYPLHGYSW